MPDVIPTPAPEVPVTAPTLPATPATQETKPSTRAERRAAVIAKVQTTPEPAKETAVVAEKATTDPAKGDDKPKEVPSEVLSPQMAALAKKEAETRKAQQEFKAQQEAWKAEQATKAAELGSVQELHTLAKTNPIAFADKVKLTPQERRDHAALLAWSSYSEAEQNAFRRSDKPEHVNYAREMDGKMGQIRPLTEAEALKAKLEEQAKSFEAYKQEQIQAEQTRNQTMWLDKTVSEVKEETYPHVAAMLEADAKNTRNTLLQIALEHARENPEAPITTELAAGALEKFLAERFKVFARIYGPKKAAEMTQQAAATAPKSISEATVAAPSAAPAEPKTREERRARAIQKIEAGAGKR